MVNGIMDFEFQDNCVEFLIDKTLDPASKQVITVKAPTGAGKTVMLIKYVDEYLKNTSGNTAFVWLCPGKGDLEQQSMDKMSELTPQRDTRNLLYSMLMGFEGGSVTFINWELVTKKGNTALKDGEKANLFETIAAAHRDGIQFVVIIDEEHLNNTKKADDIIRAFAAKNIIRVSATAQKVAHHEYYEIPEDEVINAGLITRAIYVNEGVDEKKQITNDYEYLLELADEKRKEIQAGYDAIKTKIRPLVLIQFPMGQPETIAGVEAKLESMGYTYDNGMVSIWMSDIKRNIDDLTGNDGSPAFLLMKQAISTGWDCPRAKILVKLREGGSEDFQIQTIGRIRRMPEKKHYGLNTLDYCYIYTLDSHYKMGLLSSMDKAYQVRRLFVRDEAKDFVLTKELRNLDFDGLGERETLEKVYEYFKKKYKQLKIDFKGCTAQMGGRQMSFVLEPKQAEFSIPEMEIYKYSEVKKRQLMRLNAYLEYTNEFITDKTRSMPERLFERYCETRPDRIEWVYKNGDTGQQYLSIVYLDGFLKQWLFYPDYIVKTNDGQVWLIETKGGEVAGHSKNIDIQVENKFIAFKQYAEKYKLNFGFVRDINEDLFINNTEYHEDMSHDSWRPLSDLL